MTDRAPIGFDHNRLLKKVANEVFASIGLVQQGSSRTWFDDHGWWVVMVTFDPSGFGKGSYLKVATSPLWDPVDYVGFAYEFLDRWDHPNAKGGTTFIDARRPDWWERDVRILGAGAIARVQELRAGRHDVRTFLELDLDRGGDVPKDRPYTGIPAGLLGIDDVARDGLADLERLLMPNQFTHRSAREAWDEWVAARIADLQRAVGDRDAFLRLVADNVIRLRASQKLETLPIETIVGDLDDASRRT